MPSTSAPPVVPLVVAVAASAGGVRALRQVLGALPADLPAAVLVVQHLERHRASRLAEVLGAATPLPVAEAAGGERARPGCVYVAPPDRHLLLAADGRLALSGAPPLHHSRPSGDALFRSVAAHAGRRAVAVVLTGRDADGSGALAEVKAHGGTVVVQDPETAAAPGMPRSAIATGAVDHVVPLDEVGPFLVRLARIRETE